MKTIKLSFKQIFNAFCYFYIGILLLPQTVFSNKMTYKNFTVYYHEESVLDKDIQKVLDDAIIRLEKSRFYSKNFSQKIFLCSNATEYFLFSGPSYRSLAINHPVTNNIVVSNLKERNKARSLESVLAHETTHTLLRNAFGTIEENFKIPRWKNEGYCEYISQESSLKEEVGLQILCDKSTENKTPEFAYFLNKKITEQGLNESKNHFSDWFNKSIDRDSMIIIIQKKYCAQ